MRRRKMVNGINNIFDRINNIRNGAKALNNNLKPEFIKEFENNYKKIASENLNKTNVETDKYSIKNNSIHPYLAKKEKEILNNPDNAANKVQIKDAVKSASQKYQVSEDLINAVIKVESNFDQYAVSKAGTLSFNFLNPGIITLYSCLWKKPFPHSCLWKNSFVRRYQIK